MSINSDLQALRLRTPTLADIKEIHSQIMTEQNDRGAAILSASLVENAITYAIQRRNTRFQYHREKLFENYGPISTFDGKILIATGMGIFGSDTQFNLNIIRHLRNTFAHASVPVRFSTPEVEAACHVFRRPADEDVDGRKWGTPREKFVAACYAICKRLSDYAAGCHQVRADRLDPATMVPVTPPSLP
jgi:hypothetical protein